MLPKETAASGTQTSMESKYHKILQNDVEISTFFLIYKPTNLAKYCC